MVTEYQRSPEFREKQSKTEKAKWADPEYRKMIIESRRAGFANPDYKKRRSEMQKAEWKDPVYREKMSKADSEGQKKRFEDPINREKMSQIIQELGKDPEYRKKLSESHSKEEREQSSERMKQRLADPDFNKKLHEWHSSPEGRKILSESHKISEKNKEHMKTLRPKFPTSLERFVYNFLDFQGVKYISQKTIKLPEKWIRVDCFVEPNKIIEANGKVFHTKGLHPFGCEIDDEERDLELNRLGFEVLRLPEDDIKQHPDEVRNRILDFLIPSRVENYS